MVYEENIVHLHFGRAKKMEQQDYLLRQAGLLGQALGKIISKLLKLKDDNDISVDTVNQVLAEEVDFDVIQLSAIDDEKWIDTLKNEKCYNNRNMEKLADIFLLIAENVHSNESRQLCKKSLMIYQYIEKSENTYSFDRNCKINQIKGLIENNTD